MTKTKSQTVSLEASINSLPGIIWFKNSNLDYIGSSQTLNDFIGFPKKDYIIGKNDYDLPWENYADVYRGGDHDIITTQKAITFLHPMRFYSGSEVIILTQKSPVFSESQEVVGISGTVSVVSKPSCIQNILQLNQYDYDLTGQNQKYAPIQYTLYENFDRFNLSEREVTCLFYLIRGKTAKEMAPLLCISKRTVEKHIDNIKVKLNCSSKSEVITKAIDLGFVYLIPNNFLAILLANK